MTPQVGYLNGKEVTYTQLADGPSSYSISTESQVVTGPFAGIGVGIRLFIPKDAEAEFSSTITPRWYRLTGAEAEKCVWQIRLLDVALKF